MILSPHPGAHISGAGSAFPRNLVDQDTAAATLATLFPDEDPEFVTGLVRRSGVEQRYVVPTLEEVVSPSNFTQRNAAYRDAALVLAEEASRRALADAGADPAEVDVLVDVSCTGISIPALDVDLAPRLGLRADVRRIPVTESGCAAGALALGMAGTYAGAGQTVLVVAVELCSLTLVRGDTSRTNLVASVIFGDGAASVLVRPGGSGPRIEATASHLIPGTREAMGFHVGEHGLAIRLQRELPVVLKANLVNAIDDFLCAHGREREDVGLHLVHPGGRSILDAYEELFDLPEGGLASSRDALRRYGNLSSASILTVLELALRTGVRPDDDGEALVVGVGPGLSLELSLLSFGRSVPDAVRPDQ